jgi:hypothetical protein
MPENLRSQTLTSLKTIGLSDAQIKSFAAIKSVSLADATPIAQLGFASDLVAKLPATAQHLTKADLMSLGGWGTTHLTAAAAKLSATDVASIKTVLGSSMMGGSIGKVAMDVNCCCCPCCCAAAVTVKKSISRTNSFVC